MVKRGNSLTTLFRVEHFCYVFVKPRSSFVLFHSINSFIQTDPCPSSPHVLLHLCLFSVLFCFCQQLLSLYILNESHSSDAPLITFTNLHVGPVYFNTLCAGAQPRSPSPFVVLTVWVLLNSGGGGHVAEQEGFPCWTNILGGENCPRTASTQLLWENWKVPSRDDFHNPSHLCQ